MGQNALENHGANSLTNRRKILVVACEGVFSEKIVNHSINLAERLKFDLVALSVNAGCEGRVFEKRAQASAKVLRSEALGLGIHCDHIVRTGDLGLVLDELMREVKRVEFVVIDTEENDERIRHITVPIVSVFSGSNSQGGKSMSAHGSSKSKLIGQTVGYGLVSAVMYAAVFTHSDSIMQYFTRGGWYAAFPIVTVLAFSFVHGAFAHNLWSALGIEAYQKDRVRETERKVLEKRKQLRKRPRMYAYVNPFHRIDK